jgi:glycosyltransferase involved in cell wall biosynthesis
MRENPICGSDATCRADIMKRHSELRKIAFLGDYLPRKCGIATFTHDLCTSVASRYPAAGCFVVPVNDVPGGYDYPPEVRFEIQADELDSYRRAADFLNFSNADVACLQHEYGIFGGPAGSHILALLRDLRMPVVTTLHTVLSEPTGDQRRALSQLVELSARLVVMTERARVYLRDHFDVPESKIDLIAHGIPDTPFVDPSFYKAQFGVEGKLVALTFGLISPNKGIEHMLRAMPEILREFPKFVYIVLGATHPNLLREQGERYRLSLERMAQDLAIKKNVIFDNRFVELNELTELIVAADVYVTPYLNPAQSVSGTLAYSFGCGKAVVSTPYWHAEELLADGRGVLVPFGDSNSLAREICGLLRDEPRRDAMRKRAYLLGREMVWGNVAHLYMESFQRARSARTDHALCPPALSTPAGLPPWRLDHLERLTDSTGIFQFASYGIPNFAEGYCSDDVARALLLTVLLEDLDLDSPLVERLSTTYAAFLQFAFDAGRKRFRNFLSFDRRWQEAIGSDDCQGRAVWALGACVGRSKRRRLQSWAAEHFEQALPAIVEMSSPRAWALSLLGIQEYLRGLSGDRLVGKVRDALTARLLDLFDRTATEDWPWFEEGLTYDNARLAQALIAGGNVRAVAVGLRALRWLVKVQKSPRGHFRAIGSNGFYRKGDDRAQFDQQPVEAQATVSACLEAYRATRDEAWLGEARIAFDWFLGRNDLGLKLYDPGTGGCCDGLLEDRINQNQGAESTLAFLLSLADMNLPAGSKATSRQGK